MEVNVVATDNRQEYFGDDEVYLCLEGLFDEQFISPVISYEVSGIGVLLHAVWLNIPSPLGHRVTEPFETSLKLR